MRAWNLISVLIILSLFLSSSCGDDSGDHTSAVFNCMEDETPEERYRCELKIRAGDYDGNGVINWHDSYVYHHCTACPECCAVNPEYRYFSVEAATHCSDGTCPGADCLCVLGEANTWYFNATVGDLD